MVQNVFFVHFCEAFFWRYKLLRKYHGNSVGYCEHKLIAANCNYPVRYNILFLYHNCKNKLFDVKLLIFTAVNFFQPLAQGRWGHGGALIQCCAAIQGLTEYHRVISTIYLPQNIKRSLNAPPATEIYKKRFSRLCDLYLYITKQCLFQRAFVRYGRILIIIVLL